MNIGDLNKQIERIRYDKIKFIYLSGSKNKFHALISKLHNAETISVREKLTETCIDKNISKLDSSTISSLAKEIIPKPKDRPVALFDNELFLKYNMFSTIMKGQVFQDTIYLIHIPERYKDSIKDEKIITLG